MTEGLGRATIDFESRSAVSLRKCGSWRYSLDPSTEVLCLVFRLPYWKKGRTALWHPAYPLLGLKECELGEPELLPELFEWIKEGELIEAHNAWFERGLWTNIMVPRYGFPGIAHAQWRCSAATAAALSLPRALEIATIALRLKVHKDMEGSKVMKKMTKPRKPRKKEIAAWKESFGSKPLPRLYHESRPLLEALFAYCRKDVLAEECLSSRLPDLSQSEQELYLLDQKINERGFQLDREAVSTALFMISKEVVQLNKELVKLTGGKVQKATQRKQMMEWLSTQGLDLTDTQGATIDLYLSPECQTPLSKNARRGLELMRTLGRSSTAKFDTMKQWACQDWRVRGSLLWHGASTGRWSGQGVQPHNFVRGGIKDMEEAWTVIKSKDRQAIMEYVPDEKDHPEAKMGEVMRMLAEALRGAIISSEGKNLYVADFAGIEARCLLWLADDQKGLQIFHDDRDIYMDMAGSIFGYPVTDKKKQAYERALGKVAILGLGYQMGWSKFITTAWDLGKVKIDEELSKQTVNAYRTKYAKVKQMWYDQEAAAIEAVQNKYKRVKCGKMVWVYEDIFLYCILPSGRRLAYCYPAIQEKLTSWGEKKPTLTFMAMDPKIHKWRRQTTYGGMIVENQTQAVARDFMAHGMVCAEETGKYQIVLSVHDELIGEGHPAWCSVQEFEQLMSTIPDWGEGCPVVAEGWAGKRYRK